MKAIVSQWQHDAGKQSSALLDWQLCTQLMTERWNIRRADGERHVDVASCSLVCTRLYLTSCRAWGFICRSRITGLLNEVTRQTWLTQFLQFLKQWINIWTNVIIFASPQYSPSSNMFANLHIRYDTNILLQLQIHCCKADHITYTEVGLYR
jgi:hypothetical protein